MGLNPSIFALICAFWLRLSTESLRSQNGTSQQAKSKAQVDEGWSAWALSNEGIPSSKVASDFALWLPNFPTKGPSNGSSQNSLPQGRGRSTLRDTRIQHY
jgi:hypothetical protein